jgi:VIT1/CCC1 family predicted Fe2+/Mn2+ transporter
MSQFTRRHVETQKSSRIGWLRAAVLGANDGIVSTGCLLIGVAAASTTHQALIVTGVAGLVAGAMSMAAGEYVSVHSQADTEQADLAGRKKQSGGGSVAKHRELADLYIGRGLEPRLATQVAQQLMAHDALHSHARDELSIPAGLSAKPLSAALASAMSFTVGAALPVAVTVLVPLAQVIFAICLMSLLFLALLGAIAAKAGGASLMMGACRVTFWGALAMVVTTAVGRLFGAAV